MTQIINLADRRVQKTFVEPELTEMEARAKYIEERKNLLDFLTTTLVVCNKQSELTEAIVFIRDPETGGFMPGATSQKVMDDLLAMLGVESSIRAIPEES